MQQELDQEDKELRQVIYEGMYGLGDVVNNRPVPRINRNIPLDSGYDRTETPNDIRDKIAARKEEEYQQRYVGDPTQRHLNIDGFQITAKERFLNKDDTFLSIPPSRGKTDPIIGGFRVLFRRHLLKSRNINYTPTLLFVVPRKQLAAQITTKDVFDDIVIPILNPLNTNKCLPEERAEGLDTSHLFPEYQRLPNDRAKRDYGLRLAESLTAEIVGGATSNINYVDDLNTGLYFSFKPIIVATYEKAAKVLNSKISHIVIDEMQELLPHPGDTVFDKNLYNKNGDSESLGSYGSLADILKRAPSGSSITLMTGSVNDISVREIAEYFNKHYARRFKVVPDFNMTALNRSPLSVQPLQSMAGFSPQAIQNRINLCKKIIIENQTNSLMIIFSNSQTGQGIFRIIQEIIRMIPARNPSFVSAVNDMDTIRPANLGRDINEFEYLKYFDIADIFKGGSKSSNSMTTPDENNILYQGVLRGIAPLNGKMDQYHKKTVQKLFIDKKIQLILATDALGVGANVECQYLYIPTTSKFDGSKLARVDESSLTQLMHRVGRGKFDAGIIYCSIQDFDYINHLVFNDPRSAVPKINPYLLQDLQTLEKENGASFVKKLIAKAIFK